MPYGKFGFTSIYVFFFDAHKGIIKKSFAERTLKVSKLNNCYFCIFISQGRQLPLFDIYFCTLRNRLIGTSLSLGSRRRIIACSTGNSYFFKVTDFCCECSQQKGGNKKKNNKYRSILGLILKKFF